MVRLDLDGPVGDRLSALVDRARGRAADLEVVQGRWAAAYPRRLDPVSGVGQGPVPNALAGYRHGDGVIVVGVDAEHARPGRVEVDAFVEVVERG